MSEMEQQEAKTVPVKVWRLKEPASSSRSITAGDKGTWSLQRWRESWDKPGEGGFEGYKTCQLSFRPQQSLRVGRGFPCPPAPPLHSPAVQEAPGTDLEAWILWEFLSRGLRASLLIPLLPKQPGKEARTHHLRQGQTYSSELSSVYTPSDSLIERQRVPFTGWISGLWNNSSHPLPSRRPEDWRKNSSWERVRRLQNQHGVWVLLGQPRRCVRKLIVQTQLQKQLCFL